MDRANQLLRICRQDGEGLDRPGFTRPLLPDPSEEEGTPVSAGNDVRDLWAPPTFGRHPFMEPRSQHCAVSVADSTVEEDDDWNSPDCDGTGCGLCERCELREYREIREESDRENAELRRSFIACLGLGSLMALVLEKGLGP